LRGGVLVGWWKVGALVVRQLLVSALREEHRLVVFVVGILEGIVALLRHEEFVVVAVDGDATRAALARLGSHPCSAATCRGTKNPVAPCTAPPTRGGTDGEAVRLVAGGLHLSGVGKDGKCGEEGSFAQRRG
jgi:hypothetical protein